MEKFKYKFRTQTIITQISDLVEIEAETEDEALDILHEMRRCNKLKFTPTIKEDWEIHDIYDEEYEE